MSCGMSIAVKCVLAKSHQMVKTAMSQAYTSCGNVNSRSSFVTLIEGNLPFLYDTRSVCVYETEREREREREIHTPQHMACM